MLKKFKSKDFLSGIIFTLVLVTSINVFASGMVKEKIDVIYNNIKLVVDGKPVAFGKNESGKQIEPFIYNGTTYLPVRAVGEALGKKVNWDGKTQTVYIGEKPGGISYMTEVIEPYQSYQFEIYNLNNSKKLNMGGKEYNTGYIIDKGWNNYAYFNLNSQYKEIEFEIGALNTYNDTLDIYVDGNLYKTIEVKGNELPKKVSIPVSGVMQLRFEHNAANYHSRIGIGDPIIK